MQCLSRPLRLQLPAYQASSTLAVKSYLTHFKLEEFAHSMAIANHLLGHDPARICLPLLCHLLDFSNEFLLLGLQCCPLAVQVPACVNVLTLQRVHALRAASEGKRRTLYTLDI